MENGKLEIVIEHDTSGVSPDPFFAIIRATIDLLRGTEKLVDGDAADEGRWRISKISLNSPLHIVLSKFSNSDNPVSCAGIRPLIDDMARLDRGKPVKVLTPDLQNRAKSLVENMRQGIVGIVFINNDLETRLTQRIAASVDESIGRTTRHTEIGSVEGRLEIINIHNNEAITVWDVRYGKPVNCNLGMRQLQEAKELLGRRVRVRGVISYKKRRPHTITEVIDIRELRSTDKLPQPADLGVIDLFGTVDPVEYLRGDDHASN